MVTIHFFVESLFSFFFSVLSSDFTWLVSEVATILESSKVSAEEIISESGVGIFIVFAESIEEMVEFNFSPNLLKEKNES